MQQEQIEKLIEEREAYDFASVCEPDMGEFCENRGLMDSDVKVCTVIGFPLEQLHHLKALKQKSYQNGADEIDMVINVGALKSGNLDLVESDIRAVVEASGDKLVKVIIEACLQ